MQIKQKEPELLPIFINFNGLNTNDAAVKKEIEYFIINKGIVNDKKYMLIIWI